MSPEYQSLYRKYRPSKFSEILGQRHVTQTIANAIKSGRISHAYLFCGPRGTGKTSTARALAEALNCEKGPTPESCGVCEACVQIKAGSSLDVIEFDAASHRGVEDIEELRHRFQFSPGSTRYKVYIIDEVHQLSDAAFDMLLKVLEEPPAQVVFVLATTETHKVKATILSRCQRFDFHRIDANEISTILRQVCKAENIDIEEEAVALLANAADGSARDALSLLDQAAAFTEGTITSEEVRSILGGIDPDILLELASILAERRAEAAFALIDRIVAAGKDLAQVIKELMRLLRDLLVIKLSGREADEQLARTLLSLPKEYLERMREQAAGFTQQHLLEVLDLLSRAEGDLRYSNSQRLVLELFAARACGIAPQEQQKSSAQPSSATAPTAKPPSQAPRPKPSMVRDKPASKAATKPPAPPAKKAGSNKAEEMDVVREKWPQVLSALKAEKHAGLFACAQSATPSRLEGEKLILTFTSEFNQSRIAKQESKAIVEKTIEKVMGRRLKIECRLRSSEAPAKTNEEDNLLGEALEIFPGSEVL